MFVDAMRHYSAWTWRIIGEDQMCISIVLASATRRQQIHAGGRWHRSTYWRKDSTSQKWENYSILNRI